MLAIKSILEINSQAHLVQLCCDFGRFNCDATDNEDDNCNKNQQVDVLGINLHMINAIARD